MNRGLGRDVVTGGGLASLVKKRRHALLNWLNALVFLAPALLLYWVFVLRTTIEVVHLSFYEWDGVSPQRAWIGLENYSRLLSDRIFWSAFLNTLEWAAIIVVANVVGGLVLAALLAQRIRGRAAFQLAIFLPVIQAPITTAVIWRWMYQPDGAVNVLLREMGLGFMARPWLGDFVWALPALAVAHIWASLGLSVVIFLAGLQAVDTHLYEAAEIDGANRVQIFHHVTVPSLKPVTAMVLMLVMTQAFKVFDLIWATTRGGPIRSTEVLATYMYKRGILENTYGYGATVAVALLIIVSVFSFLYLLHQQRREQW
jgi:raffinose/stachyose/melibiose transport system permease protein